MSLDALDAPLMNDPPASVEEAWRWIETILAGQPHGKSYWQIEQEKERVRWLCRWIREQTDSLLPFERLFDDGTRLPVREAAP